MAKKHSSKRRRKGRSQTTGKAGTPQGQPNDPGGSEVISKRATDAIDAQRRSLQMAESVMGCLVTALEYASWVPRKQRPDYSDAVRAVRRMIAAAIDRLDSVNLKRTIAAAKPGSA